MIEIPYQDSKIVNDLYKVIRDLIVSKQDNKTYEYKRKQHHLYEEDKVPGISRNYFNEYGSVEFENSEGNIIRLEISRWHPHKHNGCSGLNGNPCLNAYIYLVVGEEKTSLWELKVGSGTLYYKAEVSSLEIPFDILKEKEIPIIVEEEPVVEEEESPKEPEEKRILFEEISNLHKKSNSIEQQKRDLLVQKKKAIEEAIKRINESYDSKLVECDNSISSTKDELIEFNKLLQKYSTFNIDQLGKAISKLISLIESEEYVYKKVSHQFQKRVHGVMDSWDEDVETKANIVVKKEQSVDCYTSFEIDLKDGILLSEYDSNTTKRKLTIYAAHDGQITSSINFGRFTYVKEFLDKIIQYRFMWGITEFTEQQMLSFIGEFMLENKDTILSNYSTKLEERALKLKI